MKYLIPLFVFVGFSISAQQSFNCFSHIEFEKNMANDPVFRANQEQLERETALLLQTPKPDASATYIIPVVFHIIYSAGYGNISDAQILDQMAILNKEFRRLQPDTALTPAAFKSLAAPFDVEFRLATIDPNGQCTNGINRLYSSLTNCSLDMNEVKSLSRWPSHEYLNIWIIQSMHYPGDISCTGGGYSSFPGNNAANDGIVMRGDLIGSIGTATGSSWGNFLGRYLIHELGHWFNLRHIWGDIICGNDLVSDTPPAQFSNSNCPSFPHNPNNTCGGGPNGEMFTNYMDYTNGPCLNMFSAGQVTRMTAAITSAVSGRNNLWSPLNLSLTGTSDPYTYPVACGANPAVGPFTAITICSGDSAKFTDLSYGGNQGTRLWNFNGQPSSSLTDSIVWVKFPTAGKYSVSLTKTYLSISKTTNFPDKVIVLDRTPNANYVVPFVDGFENSLSYNADWTVVNGDSNTVTWEHNSATAYSGLSSVGLQNFGSQAPLFDELYSPTYDLSSVVNPTLTFRVHYTQRESSDYDKLQVFVSKNCGAWMSVYQRTGLALATNTLMVNNSYTPAAGADDEWRLEKINLIPAFVTGTVHFKFVFSSGGGNNIFIDDINLKGINTTGLSQAQQSSGISIFPNPSKGKLTINFGSAPGIDSEITLVDVSGRICYSEVIDKQYKKSELDLHNIETGLYIISIKQNGNLIQQQKFVKIDE